MAKDGIKFYQTVMNEWFAVESSGKDERVYYSANGKSFLRLFVAGSSSSQRVVTNYIVENPHEGFGWKGNFKFNGEIFVLEREDSPHRPIFRPAEALKGHTLLPLPHIVVLKGLYTMPEPDGRFLFWTGLRYDHTDKDVKFYFGHLDCLEEIEVISSDDSSIVTMLGVLSIHGKGFDGYRLNVLDHNAYRVEVGGEKIRLVHKKDKGA